MINKKYIVSGLLLIGMVMGLSGCNSQNSVGVTGDSTPSGFQDTGLQVKNPEDRVYNIIKNKYGYLYYSSSQEGSLAEVLNKDGKPTTDINDIK